MLAAICHACQELINVGQTFKLVPHMKPSNLFGSASKLTDEMCCAQCGEAELVKRDKREAKAKRIEDERRQVWPSPHREPGYYQGGYSRPSKGQSEGAAKGRSMGG